MTGFFDLRYQPNLETLFNGITNLKNAIPFYGQYIGGAAVTGSEVFANANPLINYVQLFSNFHNVEGANRTLSFVNSAGNNVYVAAALATATSQPNTTLIVFRNISPSLGLVNAATSFTFVGFRLILI